MSSVTLIKKTKQRPDAWTWPPSTWAQTLGLHAHATRGPDTRTISFMSFFFPITQKTKITN